MQTITRAMLVVACVAATWAFACGGGEGRSSATSPAAPSAAAASTARVRVLTWNLHQGYTGTQRHVNREQIELAASLRPDIVAFQELAEWDNDMPGVYRDGLQQRTGRAWTLRYEPHLPSAPRSRLEGSGLATWLPVEEEAVLRLDDPSRPDDHVRNRAAVRLRVNVNGTSLVVATTHLDHLDPANRRSQLDRLQAWLAGAGPRRIVVGDFNAEPHDAQTFLRVATEYADAWVSLVNPERADPGFTVQKRSATKAPGRIDYQWYRGVEPAAIQLLRTDLGDRHALLVEWIVAVPD